MRRRNANPQLASDGCVRIRPGWLVRAGQRVELAEHRELRSFTLRPRLNVFARHNGMPVRRFVDVDGFVLQRRANREIP
jgi:hypothetical protein